MLLASGLPACWLNVKDAALVLLLQDAGTAKKLAFSREVNTRCITLEGDDFNPGGTLTGGSRNKGGSGACAAACGRQERWHAWHLSSAASVVHSKGSKLAAMPSQDGKLAADRANMLLLLLLLVPAVLARLHELAEAEGQLQTRQARLRECEAALKAMSAAAASFKKYVGEEEAAREWDSY